MTVKWKIFLALNFVLALPSFVFLIILIINFLKYYSITEDTIFFLLFLFGLSMITLNGFLNIYLLQRFFPDKIIPISIKRINLLSLILTSIIAVGMLIMFIYATAEEFGNNNAGRNANVKIALAILLFALIILVIILIMQAKLPRLISRNNHEKMDSLINSIGNSA